MQKFISYFRVSKAELGKVIFPLKIQVRNSFITVLVVVSVIALFLAIVDALMAFGLSKII